MLLTIGRCNAHLPGAPACFLRQMVSGIRSFAHGHLSEFLLLALFFIPALALGWSADQQPNAVEAARLNDIGVALMNQQLTEKAIAKFDEAHAADPRSAIPLMNKGIALVYLRKLPEAEEALKQAGLSIRTTHAHGTAWAFCILTPAIPSWQSRTCSA